jgi:hypothetical protein
VKASNSGAFNRVVNRKLYSKKVVLSVVFAFVMVASAFMIAAQARAGNVTPSLEAWRLLPDETWTKGDVKGYSEGQFIPVNVTLGKPSTSTKVGVRLGFEWGKDPTATTVIRGFDSVCKYPGEWIDAQGQAVDPLGPFNPAPTGDPLFYAEPDTTGYSKGTWVVPPVQVTDDSSKPYFSYQSRYWVAWDLKFDFYTDYKSVHILCGGILFQTTDTSNGASYYAGSSLHIRLLGTYAWNDDNPGQEWEYTPSAGGSQDVPINVAEIPSPPKLTMTKTFTPDVCAPFEYSTIKLTIQNHGQEDAYLLNMYDHLPDGLDYVGLLKTWTSHDSGPGSAILYNPVHVGEDELHWDFSDPLLAPYEVLPGTAVDGSVWARYFTFLVVANDFTVSDTHDRVTVTNYASVYYTDIEQVCTWSANAEDTLTLVKVAVDIEKTAWSDDQKGEEIDCAARNYDANGDGYIDAGTGDTIYYRIAVENTGTENIVNFNVYDEKLSPTRSGEIPIWTEPLGGGTGTMPLIPGASIYKFFEYTFDENEPVDVPFENTATVKEAHDAAGREATDYGSASVNLVRPDVLLTKEADREIAAWYDDPNSDNPEDGWGEIITYTITVTNLDDETHVDFVVMDDWFLYLEDDNVNTYTLTGNRAWTGTLEPAGDPDGLDTASLTLRHKVTYDDPAKITNTAYLKTSSDPEPGDDTFAYCVDPLTHDADTHDRCWGRYPLYREASESVDKVNPRIEITKVAVDDADPTNGDNPIDGVNPPGVVTYKILVDNTGDVGLWWFYWDSFSDPDWTPVASGPMPGDPSYVIDGCWAVGAVDSNGDGSKDDGVYCAQVPQATSPLVGFIGISTHDTFVGTEYSYEVEITSYDAPHWRAGVYFRYTDPGNTYIAHIDDGIYLYRKIGGVATLLDSDSGPDFLSGTPYKLRVDVDQLDDGRLYMQVYVDGVKYLEAWDASPLSGEKIGLSLWDERECAVHVHFDDVIVRDIANPSNILLEDHFECLVPVEDYSNPEIPFAVPPGLPAEFGCDQGCKYYGRLASGYLEPGDSAFDPGTPENPADARYYTYDIQDDDPQQLVNTVSVYGWHNPDKPEWWAEDDDSETVERYVVLWGYAFNDVHKTSSVGPWYGMFDGVRNTDGLGDYFSDEWGVSDPGGATPKILVTLWDWDGTWDYSDPLNPVPDSSHMSNPRTQITAYDTTYGDGYYKFSSLDPGDYVVDITITNPVSTDSLDKRYGSWFVTKHQWWSVEDMVGGDEEQRDFGIAKYGYIESYKWLDWNPNGVVEPELWVVDIDNEEVRILEVGLNGWEIHIKGVDFEGNPYPGPTADDDLTMPTAHKDGGEVSGEAFTEGWYKFMLKPGTYEVWEVLPDDWGTSTTKLEPGMPDKPENYKPHYWNIMVADGVTDFSAKFGNYPLMTIWGVKFFDKDNDGEQDWTDSDKDSEKDPGEVTEPGLNDWTMKLWRWDVRHAVWGYYAYPAPGDDQMEATTATVDGINGYYEFAGLPPGTYKVTEVIDDTDVWFMTTDSEHLEGVEPVKPMTPDEAQQVGPQTLGPVNVGNLRYAKISGYKFLDSFGNALDPDAWPDGIFDRNKLDENDDPAEVGLPDWAITLVGTTAWGDPVKYNFEVDADGPPAITADGFGDDPLGYYSYDNVYPGEYWVSEVVLDNWVATNGSSHKWTVPAYPWGPQIVIWQCFGNVLPTPDQDPEVGFALKAGWNMWSSPIEVSGLTAKVLLGAIGPAGLLVVKYDTTDGELVFVSQLSPPGVDFAIVFGQGYYVVTTSDVWFSLLGYPQASSQISLVSGWNLIGYNQLEPMKASDLMASVSGCSAVAIMYEDVQTGETFMYTALSPPELDFDLVHGKAYFLMTSGDGTLTFGG